MCELLLSAPVTSAFAPGRLASHCIGPRIVDPVFVFRQVPMPFRMPWPKAVLSARHPGFQEFAARLWGICARIFGSWGPSVLFGFGRGCRSSVQLPCLHPASPCRGPALRMCSVEASPCQLSNGDSRSMLHVLQLVQIMRHRELILQGFVP